MKEGIKGRLGDAAIRLPPLSLPLHKEEKSSNTIGTLLL